MIIVVFFIGGVGGGVGVLSVKLLCDSSKDDVEAISAILCVRVCEERGREKKKGGNHNVNEIKLVVSIVHQCWYL